jgi:hypothetical protein
LAFWYFDEDDPVRVWVYNHIVTTRYDIAMLVIILANCICMALEGPRVVQDSTLGQTLRWSDVGFTAIFGVEVLLKCFAFTFRLYIKEVTNQVGEV